MADTPPTDAPSSGGDFDMMDALDWKDGIASLPGSDIRFRMTEFGTLEIVTEVEADASLPSTEILTPQNQDPCASHSPTPPPETVDPGLSQASGPEDGPLTPVPELEPQCSVALEEAPSVEVLSVEAPSVEVLSVEAPSVEAPSVEVLSVEAPSVEAPSVEVLSVEAPSVEVLSVEAPSVEVLSCGSCGLPGSQEAFLLGKFCSPACVQPTSGRSTPGDQRERGRATPVPAAEGDRLGKRVRKKRKLYMDSADDDDENVEEEEEKAKVCKGRRAAKLARLVTAPPPKKKAWSWATYLEEERAIAAPVKLFREHQSFPQSRNSFKVGMKLEGLDPCHPSLFCVLSVAEVQGYRVRLHFDGYPECYDFWVNADSWDMKPAGWCEKNGHKLLLPKGCRDGEFSWNTYVKNCRGQIAPKHLFKSLNTSVTPSGFRVGMKLEAVDRKNPSLICVASIAAAVDSRLLIHFDNWDDSYDYWCDASSPYIHPVGYCEEAELTLTTPAEYKHPKSFSWEKYLEETGTQAAPARAFKQVGMKVEAVDKRNAMLIRVASIAEVEEHRLKIHFDGWGMEYDYWLDADSPDLHPVGWSQKTGHPLQNPQGSSDASTLLGQGCPTPGCNGVGHRALFRCSGGRKSWIGEGDRSGRSSLSEPSHCGDERPGGAGEHSHNGTKPKKSGQLPKCLKLHFVKQEPGDGADGAVSLQQALHESVFSPSSPMQRILLCWDKHCKLLPEVLGLTARQVAQWSTDEVASFVRGLPGCRDHAVTFRNEQIDGEAFLLLTQADIVKILSIKLGPALKIYNSILMFKSADEE
ncbi:hypothetical protein ANANG_G00026600 [Anguilla anguilla]|uniref:SAM domain-containing protein n=1 Tax=Anguilla anguilla TaxID=7936 RepID=A0A9D3MZE2_ANGAN|nr:hypothetical protein ANANG_G00026600 [Anguilla anguilla]